MKTNILLLGAVALTIASCSKNEVVDMAPGLEQKGAITFENFVGKSTKAVTENNLDALKEAGKGFYVHGKYKRTDDTGNEETAFDGGQQAHVTWSGNSWGYNPLTYWLEGHTYKFAAFAPALSVNHSFDYVGNSLTITDFVADGKTDLLVSATTQEGIKSDNYIASNSPIQFTFRHALSKVKFTFKDGWRNRVNMKIDNIYITSVETKGTLKTPGNLVSADIPVTSWTGGNVLSNENTYKDVTGNTLSTYGATYDYEHCFIPQNLAEKGIKLHFTVTITNDNNEGPDIGGEEGSKNTKKIEVELPTTTVNQWIPAYAYNYVIEISGDTFGLKPISFTIDEENGIAKWNDRTMSDDAEINVDQDAQE